MVERCVTETGVHEFEPRYHSRYDPVIVNKIVEEYNSPLDHADEIKEVAEIREYVYDVCVKCGATTVPPQTPSE